MANSYETVWSQNSTATDSRQAESNDGHSVRSVYHTESHKQQTYLYDSQPQQSHQHSNHSAHLVARNGIQWSAQQSYSQPASQYYSPHQQQVPTYGTTQETESEWGTIEKRSL